MCHVGKKWSDLATRRTWSALCYRQDSGGAQHGNRRDAHKLRNGRSWRSVENLTLAISPVDWLHGRVTYTTCVGNRRSWNWGSQGCPGWQPLVAHPVRMLLLLLVWLSKYQNACPISLSKMHPVFLSLYVFQSNPDPAPRTNCSSSMYQCG